VRDTRGSSGHGGKGPSGACQNQMSNKFHSLLHASQAAMKPKKQSLSFVNGYAVPRDSSEDSNVALANAFENATPRGELKEYTPEYVKTAGLVLRFNAYFDEAVENSQSEKIRSRKFIIYFFVEDGSIKITEPRLENSGILQGMFLKRHVVDGFSASSLNVGSRVNIYGFEFNIYSCDGFTRRYLGHMGLYVPEDAEAPNCEDPLRAKNDRMLHTSPSAKKDARGKFLTHDKQVLRFYCVWDDRVKLGDRRKFILTFYLIDDTVAITENEHAKGSRGGMSATLLHRCRLPLHDEDVIARGPADNDYDYVTAENLRIGGFVRVYKRDFFLYDCDEFTKSWYLTKHPSEFSEIDFEPRDVFEPEEELPKRGIPDHTGLAIGSEEDSLQNCIALIPKAPRKEFSNDEGVVLRFRAFMVPFNTTSELNEFDASRRFVVSFYVGDKTLSIYEQASKDVGSSKFLERIRVKNGSQCDGSFYDVNDMHVGSVLKIYSRAFELYDADAYSLNYLNGLKQL